MSTITTSDVTTQLLIKAAGVDIYTALKLPSDQVTMDNTFFQGKNVNDVMPQIYTDVCPALQPDGSGVCTWTISDNISNSIKVTDKVSVLNIKDSSGNVVIAAQEVITYGILPNTTYALNIYINSTNPIAAGTYSAVIKL